MRIAREMVRLRPYRFRQREEPEILVVWGVTVFITFDDGQSGNKHE